MDEELVRMAHINKFYGRVQALDDVNFSVGRKEIVGLLGDNGAGKSTLIKVLSGAVRATSGDIIVRGNRVDIRSTTDAIALGIETIYQDSALVTQLSIARNLFLGREPLKGPRFLNRMDAKLMEEVAGDLLRGSIRRQDAAPKPASAGDHCPLRWLRQPRRRGRGDNRPRQGQRNRRSASPRSRAPEPPSRRRSRGNGSAVRRSCMKDSPTTDRPLRR